MEIVKQLPKVKNAAVRFASVSSIDHLTQKEPAPVADALQKIVDENKAKDDRNMMQAEWRVNEIIYRLRALKTHRVKSSLTVLCSRSTTRQISFVSTSRNYSSAKLNRRG